MEKSKYLVIGVLILFIVSLGVSYSYFSANIISNGEKETKVNTGKVSLKIDEEDLGEIDILPIFDEDYETKGYKKYFNIISSSSLNTCGKIYLDIKEISENLKSKYFKYKVISGSKVVNGSFENAQNNSEMLLVDNEFIESDSTNSYILYIWLSYDKDEDQMSMLGTKLKASIIVKGVDARDLSSCN